MKIWYGDAYHARGEKQLSDYLNYYHLKKGYMLSFNFNKKKKIGVQEIMLGDKVLVEAVVQQEIPEDFLKYYKKVTFFVKST